VDDGLNMKSDFAGVGAIGGGWRGLGRGARAHEGPDDQERRKYRVAFFAFFFPFCCSGRWMLTADPGHSKSGRCLFCEQTSSTPTKRSEVTSKRASKRASKRTSV
jgi:hypothetical protein